MEYSHTYEINRKMHARPCVDVSKTAEDLHRHYPQLEIILEDPKTHRSFDYRSIITLLLVSNPFHKGGKVMVTASGEYPLKTLKECVDKIGGIFSFRDGSRTAWEELYKSRNGEYPDGKP